MAVDPRSDRPVYQQIADELRNKITSGELAPGSKLPSEAELSTTYSVARLTARRALAVLAAEGRTDSVRGVGVFVTKLQPIIRFGHSRLSREARAKGLGAFAAEAERLGLPWEQENLETGVVLTPSEARDVLGEDESFVKRRRMVLAGVPTQLADSYVPLSLAKEIGFDRGASAPGGLYGLLDANGHKVTRFREELSVRPASADESAALQLSLGAPVAVLRRIAMDQDGRACEWFDSVAAGDKHVYVYEFDAPE